MFYSFLVVISSLDRRCLVVKPLAEIKYDLNLSCISRLGTVKVSHINEEIFKTAERITQAKIKDASIILMIGAHVIRSGVQNYLIDLMGKGYISSAKSEEKIKMEKDKRTYKIIDAVMKVHKEMGCGFLEAVYQEALDLEFKSQGVPYKAQPFIEIFYKGKLLEKQYQPDFIYFNEVVVEIKALEQLSGTEESQIINYLKTTGFQVGLLINFESKSYRI